MMATFSFTAFKLGIMHYKAVRWLESGGAWSHFAFWGGFRGL